MQHTSCRQAEGKQLYMQSVRHWCPSTHITHTCSLIDCCAACISMLCRMLSVSSCACSCRTFSSCSCRAAALADALASASPEALPAAWHARCISSSALHGMNVFRHAPVAGESCLHLKHNAWCDSWRRCLQVQLVAARKRLICMTATCVHLRACRMPSSCRRLPVETQATWHAVVAQSTSVCNCPHTCASGAAPAPAGAAAAATAATRHVLLPPA